MIPSGIQALIRQMHTGCTAVSFGSTGLQGLYDIANGVLQGCPLSGLVFVWILDPILSALTALTDASHDGITRACADDVGASLKWLVALKGFFTVFQITKKVSAMELNTKKCILVPSASSWTMNLAHEFSSWLHVNIPAWADFKVRPMAKYLGFFLGPGAVLHSWVGPLPKFDARTRSIAAARASPCISAT